MESLSGAILPLTHGYFNKPPRWACEAHTVGGASTAFSVTHTCRVGVGHAFLVIGMFLLLPCCALFRLLSFLVYLGVYKHLYM